MAVISGGAAASVAVASMAEVILVAAAVSTEARAFTAVVGSTEAAVSAAVCPPMYLLSGEFAFDGTCF